MEFKLLDFDQWLFEVNNSPLYTGILCRPGYDKSSNDSDKKYGEQNDFFKRLIEYGKSIGLTIFVFDESSTNLDDRKCKGYTPDGDEWIEKEYPLPYCVYNRDPGTSSEFKQSLYDKGCIHFNPSELVNVANDKLKTYELLKTANIPMPYTEKYDENNLLKFAKDHGIVYLKPVNGSMGKGIICIKHKDAAKDLDKDFLIKYEENEESCNEDSLVSKINPIFKHLGAADPESYLMQKGIDVQLVDDSVFDIRVLMQRDGKGNLLLTGFNTRCGEKNKITSNIHTGGSAERTSDILTKMYGKDKKDEILDNVRGCSWDICKCLDKKAGKIGELGIDFVLDKEGNIYLIEINTRPGRTIFAIEPDIKENAENRPIDYCKYLSLSRY